MRRLLFQVHRWVGVVMCLFFAMWFASGIVMMYVDYPELTEQERLANLPQLQTQKISISAGEALLISQMEGEVSGIRVTSLADRPVYQFSSEGGQLQTVYADTGQLYRSPNPDQALAAVSFSGFSTAGANPRYDEKVEMDQWTVSSSLNKHRPLHKVSLPGETGVVLYVSDLTGQIVRDTNRWERFWNWFGSTLHWIYPMQLRRHGELWVDVIVYLSLLGIFSTLTGGIIGIMRLRIRKRVRGSELSPYKGIAWWHHILGLSCLVFISTFIFSGLMSMGPFGIFGAHLSLSQQVSRYTGGDIVDIEKAPAPDWQDLAGVKEIEWQQIGGIGHLVLSYSSTNRQVVLEGVAQLRPESLQNRMKAAIGSLLPENKIVRLDTLTAYDNYYYSRHNQYRPLPVLRARFDDPESTWFHLDMNTGVVLTRHTDTSRLERWLYHGLHSLDFSFLIEAGILWDLIVISLCVIGFLFSVTSVILGWRQLR